MTRGEVQYDRTATVFITIRGRSGADDIGLDAIIDTGFDGFLSLPPDTVSLLKLDYFDREETSVFGGLTVEFDTFLGAVEFAGEGRGIVICATDNPPLIGMSLLYGLQLTVETVDGGEVTLARLPNAPLDIGD